MSFKKITLVLIILSLAVSLGALYLEQESQEKFSQRLSDIRNFYQNVEKEVKLLSKRTAPFILTGQSTGFVIEFENGVNVYFAGDTGLSSDIRITGKYFKPEISFLPVGNIYNMDPKAAAFATNMVRSEYVIPTSYGNFPELEQNPQKFLKELKNYKGLKTKIVSFNAGETKTVLGIKILFLGGKNWLLESPQGTRILINPGIRYNSEFPHQYQDLLQLKKLDVVLITSGHFDEFTLLDTRKWGQLFDPLFLCPYELGIWLKSQLPGYKILALGEGSRIGIPEMRRLGIPERNLERIKIKAIDLVPASNSSSITPEGISP